MPPWIAEKLYQIWVVLGTAVGFLGFGVGALLLSVWVVAVSMTPLSKAVKVRVSRDAVGRGFALLVGYIRVVGRVNIKWEGWDKLHREAQGGGLLIANHPSLIDVVILIARMPQANCIVKQTLWDNPFMGMLVRACAYIPNDGRPEMLQRCQAAITRGETLIVFPEGSRTSQGQAMTLSRGAANIALLTGVAVQIVNIQRKTPFLTKEQRWYHPPRKVPGFYLSYAGRWDVSSYLALPRAKASRQLTRDWLNFLTDRGDVWNIS